MTDLHTHIVYGVDDGARSEEISMEMLHQEAENGVRNICCTSHCVPGHHAFPMQAYLEHLDQLQYRIDEAGLPLTLYTGCEILYTTDTVRMLRSGEILTLNCGRTVLTEFLPSTDWFQVSGAVRDLCNAGYSVVVAHVERYDCLRADIERLAELREFGNVMCQMNANTVLLSHGLMGDRWAKRALKSGWIDVVASDTHNTSSRKCAMKAAYDRLKKDFGVDTANLLTAENPASVLGSPAE